MTIDDLPAEVQNRLRSIPRGNRERWIHEMFEQMDAATIEDVVETESDGPDNEVPTEALSWMRRRQGRRNFNRSELEERATKIMDHWKAFDSWSTAGPSNLLRYVERVSAAHGDDSGKEMFLNTAKLLATSGQFDDSRSFQLDAARNTLVVGSIQSGKSASFVGMAAGALDAGSRVILVLSGLTNKLRNQTQARLQSDLIDHNADRLYTPTAEDDLSRYRPGDEKSERNWSWLKAACRNHLLADDGHAIVLAVKKNIATLAGAQELVAYLSNNELLGQQPILIVDDECDHASVNSMSELWDGTPAVSASQIHMDVVELRRMVSSCYVGYTASPQANCLMAKRDALAPHAAHVLESHEHYLGPWSVFVKNRSHLVDPCTVTDFPLPSKGTDAVRVLKSMAEPPLSLVENMVNHAVSGSIHRLQPRSFQPHGMRHALMVHILRDIEGQNEVHRLVLKAKETALTLLKAEGLDSELAAKAVRRFRKNRQHFRSQHNALPSKNELLRNAIYVLEQSEIRLLNSKSDDDLDYSDTDTPDNLIIIGGDVLARGLTVEGIRTTYFLREPSTPHIDSTLQSARWFGPHRGDQDLISISMRPSLVERVERIAWADAHLRDELRYLTETGQPVANARLRHHPGYRLAGKNKSRNGALYHSAGDRVTMNRPWYGTDGRAVEAFASSLESLTSTHTPTVLSTKATKGKVKTRGLMFTLSIPEFLTFWRAQVTSVADEEKHADVVRRLTAQHRALGDQAPPVHLVIRNGSRSPMHQELPASLRKYGLRRVLRKASNHEAIDMLVSGRTPGQSMYTGDWFIDGFEPTTPTAHSRGWRSIHDPVLCMMYLVDTYPEHEGRLRGEGPWIGSILHFAHSGPAGAITVNVTGNQRGEEE